MIKLNGNLGWLLSFVVAIGGWIYMAGYQASAIANLEDDMGQKVNKETIEECIKRIEGNIADIKAYMLKDN